MLLVLAATFVRTVADPGDLTRPISVTGANALADGGSTEVQLLGANGKRLSIFREGSLDVARSKQPMYFVSYLFGIIPYRRHVDRHSSVAEESRNLLESWLNGKLSAEQRAKLLSKDLSPLREIPLDVAIVFDLANWIGE